MQMYIYIYIYIEREREIHIKHIYTYISSMVALTLGARRSAPPLARATRQATRQ